MTHRPGDYVRSHKFPISGIEPMTACTGRSFPRHTHDQYGIGIIDSGGHASWSGRGQVEAGPRRVVLSEIDVVYESEHLDLAPRDEPPTPN